tara:strand:- start:603 stop:1175 length:573 start_codon:yes stop_codon:yes gene_type:complete
MARKTLLTEGEIRKFMKLAQLRPLGQDTLKEYTYDEELSEQEEEELDLDAAAPEDPEMDMGGEEEMDMDMELGADEEGGGAMAEEDVEELVQALAATIEDVTGVPVSVEGGEEEMGMGDEEEMDMGGEEEMDMAMDAGEEGEEEMGMGGEEEMVAEVARRVAERLLKKNQNEDIADKLTERIFNRLTNKG